MTPGAARRRAGAAQEQRPRPVQHPGVVRLPAPPARRRVPDRPAGHGPGRGLRLRHRRRPGIQRALGRRRPRARRNGRALGAFAAPTRSTSACATSARPLGLAFNVGMRLPAYLSGSGKAMLAWLPADEVRRRFAAGLGTRLTRKGPRDLEALLKELALTRRARLQRRRRRRARRRLLVRCAGVRRLRRGRRRDRGLHQQGAARQRSRRAPPRPGRSPSPPTCRGASAATPGRPGGSRRRRHERRRRRAATSSSRRASPDQGVQGLRRRRQGRTCACAAAPSTR